MTVMLLHLFQSHELISDRDPVMCPDFARQYEAQSSVREACHKRRDLKHSTFMLISAVCVQH